MALAADPALKAKGVVLVGVAQKDSPENIRRFLGAGGDPYAKVGLDGDGRAGIDWGVYGVPETFIVKGDGAIAFKLVGPIDADYAGKRRQAGNPQGDELSARVQFSTRRACGLSSEKAGMATSNTSPSSQTMR